MGYGPIFTKLDRVLYCCMCAHYFLFRTANPINKRDIYRPQRSCGQGYVFTRVCDSVHRGNLRAGRPPRQRKNPPDQADTPRTRQTPPRTRQTPPQTRQTPPDQGDTPPTRQTPLREADSRIRSTSGRYASYWNAFLFYSLFTQTMNILKSSQKSRLSW